MATLVTQVQIPYITTRVRSTEGRYCFQRCLSIHILGRREVTPFSGEDWGGGAGVRWTHPQVSMGIGGGGMRGTPSPGLDWGGVSGWRGYPPSSVGAKIRGWGRWDWMGYPPVQDWMGYPQPLQSGDRAVKRALVTRRAVCLLRSRRRTFLW